MKNYWLSEAKSELYVAVNQGLIELAESPFRTDIAKIREGIVEPIFSVPRIYIPKRIHRKATLVEGLALLIWQCIICRDMLETQEDGVIPLCHKSPMRLLEFIAP